MLPNPGLLACISDNKKHLLMLPMLIGADPLASRNGLGMLDFDHRWHSSFLMCLLFFFAGIIFWHSWSQEKYRGVLPWNQMKPGVFKPLPVWAWAYVSYLVLCAGSWTWKTVRCSWCVWLVCSCPWLAGRAVNPSLWGTGLSSPQNVHDAPFAGSLCPAGVGSGHCGQQIMPTVPSWAGAKLGSLFPWRKMRERKKAGRIAEYVWPV